MLSRVIFTLILVVAMFHGADIAYAQEAMPTPQEAAAPPVDEAGKIELGLFWNHIYAAYIVTWLSLIGYTLSLWVRRGPKGAAK